MQLVCILYGAHIAEPKRGTFWKAKSKMQKISGGWLYGAESFLCGQFDLRAIRSHTQHIFVDITDHPPWAPGCLMFYEICLSASFFLTQIQTVWSFFLWLHLVVFVLILDLMSSFVAIKRWIANTTDFRDLAAFNYSLNTNLYVDLMLRSHSNWDCNSCNDHFRVLF